MAEYEPTVQASTLGGARGRRGRRRTWRLERRYGYGEEEDLRKGLVQNIPRAQDDFKRGVPARIA
eukprot:753809-Hanusia_phi.AAC.2